MQTEIILTRGQIAIVDEEDYNFLINWKWRAVWDGYRFYARNAYSEAMHRIILEITDSKIHVDHIDGDSLNNRKRNLRLATSSQNQANRTKTRANTSGVKGASWNIKRNAWQAQIGFRGKNIHVGYFDDLEDASCAYKMKEIELYGEYSKFY